MLRTLILTAFVFFYASNAFAIGFMTQMNCASDYYAYCSQFQVGSKELRLCMRRVGPKLSKACLDALIADGEVSKEEVAKKKQEIAAAKSPSKQKPGAEQKGVEPKQKPTVLAKEEIANRNEEFLGARSLDQEKPRAQHQVEASREREPLILKEQTFLALKQREPRFIEEAEADEAPTPVPQDPNKRDLIVVADPANVGKARTGEPAEQERDVVHKRKVVDKSNAQKGHATSKTKLAAQKVQKQRGKAGDNDQTGSQ
jgi:hypothetical protein